MKIYSKTYYHGSPNSFDKFDFSYIGTGQGVQTHGWGIYLSKKKTVARNYKNSARVDHLVILNFHYVDGTDKLYKRYSESVNRRGYRYEPEMDYSNPLDFIAELTFEHSVTHYHQKYFNREMLEGFRETINKFLPKLDWKTWRGFPKDVVAKSLDYIDFVESVDYSEEYIDNSMLVKVIVDNDVVLAREDKRINEQTEIVQNVIHDIIRENTLEKTKEMNVEIKDLDNNVHLFDDDTFKSWYDTYGSVDPKSLSMKLLELGVDGISYNGYEDGECIVLFNLDKCEIISKE